MIETQNPRDVLKSVWGFDDFRPLQEDIIQSLLNGNDTLALLPTGGGKSLCYQVPGILKPGICIVVTPLISLMNDQVNALNDKGIKAIAINAQNSRKDIDRLLDNAIYGDFKFLYVSPERILTELFQERFTKMAVSFVAVDEAHCISQWGHDFRPAYLEIKQLRELKPEVPIMALTATATKQVIDDISSQLGLKNEALYQKSFKRDNIDFRCLEGNYKSRTLIDLIEKHEGSSIIYVRNRRKCKEWSDMLNKKGFEAYFYHAGLDHDLRQDHQEKWMKSHKAIMVATNAFGMGIDKPDVRLVVHLDLPDSMEAYYQEAGRAGRDGNLSEAAILYAEEDESNLEDAFNLSFPNEQELKKVYENVCNHLQVANHSGKGQSFHFDLNDFCSKYDLVHRNVYLALKQLEKEERISLSEGVYQSSTLQVIVTKEQLNAFLINLEKYRDLCDLLLRLYGGIMEFPANIKTADLCNQLSISKEELNRMLKYLAQNEIVAYNAKNNDSIVTFITDRMPSDQFHLSPSYHQRKKIQRQKIDAMLQYVRTETCRMQFIVGYFDESLEEVCGHCDNCRYIPQKEVDNAALENKILNLLEEKDMGPYELENALQEVRSNKLKEICRGLLDDEKIQVRRDKYSLRS